MRRVSRIVTPPSVTAVTLADQKLHTGSVSDDDGILAVYLASAIAVIEQKLQRKLITQTWKMWLDCWPVNFAKVLFGDLQSVTSIKYTDEEGTEATLANTVYAVDINSVPGRITLKYGQSWPSVTLNRINPIEIQFVTGYGAAPANVPSDIKNAILLTTSHYYENRENFLISEYGNSGVVEVPETANSLLNPHRVWDWIV